MTKKRIIMKTLTTIFFILFTISFKLFGDTPLPLPKNEQVWSKNKAFVADLSWHNQTTTVSKIDPKGNKIKIWKMKGCFRWSALSNDGKFLAVPYRGGNLLSINYEKDQIMLTLYKKGRVTKIIRLHELIENFDNLQRTVSHFYWGKYTGFSKTGAYSIKTVEGNTFILNPKTGKIKKEH